MLHIIKTMAKLKAVTIVNEKHGQEDVPSISVGVEMAVDAKLLEGIDKALPAALFRKPLRDEQVQQEIDGVAINDGMSNVRFPHEGARSWTEEFTGYTALIGSGLTTTDTEKHIEDVKLSKISYEPKDGGSVLLRFNLHFVVDEILMGAFGVSKGKMIELSLEPPYLSH